jgi:hypothetical protein
MNLIKKIEIKNTVIYHRSLKIYEYKSSIPFVLIIYIRRKNLINSILLNQNNYS